MEDVVRNDACSVLERAKYALKTESDVALLNDLSNQTIHNASIFQDDESIRIAVIIYSLSKLLGRGLERGNGINIGEIRLALGRACSYLSGGNMKGYSGQMVILFSIIKKLDRKFGIYVQEVIEKAKVKKGSNMHRHGLSIERVASILGVSQWDIMSYVGKMSLSDFEEKRQHAEARLKIARRVFR